jgi:signal transduction histidine kinase
VGVVTTGHVTWPWQESGGNSVTAQRELSTAAALGHEGHRAEAFTAGRRLLRLPPAVSDEYGVPVAFYAARLLVSSESDEDLQEIDRSIKQNLEAAWLPPAALYMIADLPKVDSRLRELAKARATEMEEAASLLDVAALENAAVSTSWHAAGSATWLLSISGQREDIVRTVVAVRAHPVLDSLKLPGRSRWALGKDSGGQPLGEGFSGVRIAVDLGTIRAPSRRWFYGGAGVLIAVMIFSAWLFNRDVQREARLSMLRSQFVSSVSHELKTPIATIRACAEMIDMGRVPESEVAGYTSTILGEAERLSRLVEGVLAFSKADQGKRMYRFQSVSLEEVARSAARAVQYQLYQGQFDLRLEIKGSFPLVNADGEAIEQAVVNLLVNAMKYSGTSHEIELSLRREGNHAVVCVRDRGIGIAPGEQERIFEKFYRAPLADQRHVPGTGLGLALVDQIVKAHCGRVEVESQVGQGSAFSILLPLGGNA